ncbi:FIST C-terminal domain-containing protein [Micromonospora sp. CPCC 205371]|nr:FIST C-terminal domain-containing protein [Micromonospora sp. CPCC 205371]
MPDGHTAMRDLVAAYPTSCVTGCSTAGEITSDTVMRDSLVAAVARFSSTRVSVASERVEHPELSHDVGRSLGMRLLLAEPDLSAIFVLSDGLGVNGSALVAGLVEGSANKVIIMGGLAGDGERFERTWILVDGEPRSGYVSALGFAGPDLKVGHGSRGGWEIFGPERRVTRSKGNVLYELDGHPALELYKRYLGDLAAGLPATGLFFPLAVRAPDAGERPLVRTILAVDEREQSMTFAGDVPEGSLAQLMCANMDRLVDGAHQAALETATEAGQPTLAIAVSCVGRRLLLGRRTEDEIDAARSALPPETDLVGFYSYGEISSTTPGIGDLHNQTMTITTIWEST